MSDDTLYEPSEEQNPVPMPPPPEEQPNIGEGGEGTAASSEKVNAQVVDALTIGTVSTTASAASNAMANMYQHQLNHIRRVDSMTEAFLGKMLKRIATDDPVEAISMSKLFKGEADSSIGSLLAQLSAGQQGAKIAQSTQGDVAAEIAKVGAAVASVQGLVGGLVGLLQQTLGTTGGIHLTPPILARKLPPAPVPPVHPIPPAPPDPVPPVPDTKDKELDPPSHWSGKFPTVTIRY